MWLTEDLQTVLTRHNIEYKTRGKNVGRDYINVCCPFCDETRYHCGIHLINPYYKCFVCNRKGGKWEVLQELGIYQRVSSDKGDTNISDKKEVKQSYRNFTAKDLDAYEWLLDIPDLDDLSNDYRPRGFDKSIIDLSIVKISTGKYDGCIAFIDDDTCIHRRFKGKSKGKWYKESIVYPPLFGSKAVKIVQPKILLITEGVFDHLSMPFGHSLAVLTNSISNGQIEKILSICKNIEKIVFCLDKGVSIGNITDELDDSCVDFSFFDWSKFQLASDIDEARLIYQNEFTEYVEDLCDHQRIDILF